MQPRPPQVVLGLGKEAFDAGRYERAVGPLAEFVERYERHPAHLAAARMLAMSYIKLGRPEEASSAASAGLARHERDPELWAIQGHAERLCGRYERSEEIFHAYMGSDAGPREVPIGAIAEVRLRLGDTEGAREWIGKADGLGVESPTIESIRGMVALRTKVGREEALGRLIAITGGGGEMDSAARASAHATMGDLLDSLGRYPEAFEQYTKSNEACEGIDFDPAVSGRRIDEVLAAWTPGVIERLQRWGDPSARPVLVVGTPRSGTTMTEMLLTRHPGCARGGELRALRESIELMNARYQGEVHTKIGKIDEAGMREGAAHYLRALDAVDPDAARVVDKMPMNLVQLGVFAALFPNGHVVHCMRDPRDACLSAYSRHFMQDHPWSRRLDWLAAFYRQYVRAMAHWRGVYAALDRPGMLEVRYEDAVADPDGWTARLAAFVGLDAAEIAGDAVSQNVPTLRPDQVGRGVYKSSSGKHGRYAAELAPLTEALSDIIEAYVSGDMPGG